MFSIGEMEKFSSNDDVLSQNDDLLISFSCSSTVNDDRSSGPGNETSFEQTGIVEIVAENSRNEMIEEMPKLIKTPEPEKSRKNVKFNLRKSLAWDSAFFTSDGVLDADELSTMIEGGEKGVKHQLPGIEEEVYRSMESISTMESDTLESLEAELFDDIRASIQKSNRTPNLYDSSKKFSSGKKDSQRKVGCSSKKMDLDSGKRPAVRIKDKSSTIPQPKIINRVNSTSTLTKRASLSANHLNKVQDIGKQALAKSTSQGSKVTGVIGPRRGVPKPASSSKSSSPGSSTAHKTEPTRPSSSCSNSSSCSTETKVKSSVNVLRKKVVPKTDKLTAGSIPKTPSRIITKNKAPPPASSRLSSNHFSSISPASSISERSSESSSTTSIVNQRSTTSRASIDTAVSYRSSVESASSIHNGIQSVVLPPSQNGSLSRPSGFQPTGLRMPSPKIGFFDGGKPGARTPNGGIRSSGVPQTGATHSSPSNSNGVKSVKIPPPKTSAAQTNMKPNFHKTAPKPAHEQPNSKSKNKICPVSSNVSDHKGEPTIQPNEETKIVPAEDVGINPTHNVDNDLNKQSNSENKLSSKTDTPDKDEADIPKSVSEVVSNECFVALKDEVENDSNKQSNSEKLSFSKTDTLDSEQVLKSKSDGLRTPFAVKNSV